MSLNGSELKLKLCLQRQVLRLGFDSPFSALLLGETGLAPQSCGRYVCLLHIWAFWQLHIFAGISVINPLSFYSWYALAIAEVHDVIVSDATSEYLTCAACLLAIPECLGGAALPAQVNSYGEVVM